jgi:glycosyltransferase involved in cell wall biosynthesis
MSDQPAVSVVMSVYNGAPLLRETMESVLAQEVVGFEVIVIDDGSSDESGAILDDYARRDHRVRVLHQENRGLTRALITGCAAARAPLIARHDAGDFSHPRRLIKQKHAMDVAPDLAFVSSWTDFVGPEGEFLYTVRGEGVALKPARIIDHGHSKGVIDGPTSHASTMFRRDTYEKAGGYRDAFYYGQDWDLWYRLAELGSFQIIPESLYSLRITIESISVAARDRQELIATYSRAALEARRRGESEEAVLRQARGVSKSGPQMRCSRSAGSYFIGEALRRNRDRRARRYLLRAALGCPILLRAWIRLAQSLSL